jgi:hypothetical protein
MAADAVALVGANSEMIAQSLQLAIAASCVEPPGAVSRR